MNVDPRIKTLECAILLAWELIFESRDFSPEKRRDLEHEFANGTQSFVRQVKECRMIPEFQARMADPPFEL